MEKLKDIRRKKELHGIALSKVLNIQNSALSNLENGSPAPMLTNMVAAEDYFKCPLDWSENENIPEDAKLNILNAFNVLSSHYPLMSVFNFFTKYISIGQTLDEPDKIINFYMDKIKKISDCEGAMDEDILLPNS